MATINDPWPKRSGKDGHPADGMALEVEVGGGARMLIADPRSYADGGPVWTLTWGDAESIKHTAASLIESYSYLLSGEISTTEAIRRLREMRRVREMACRQPV